MQLRMLLLALVVVPASAKPDSAGWVIARGSHAEIVRAHEHYDLLALQANGYLGLRPGRTTNELTTRGNATGAVEIVLQTGTELRCGDAFALRVDGAYVVQGDATPLSLVTTKKLAPDGYQWRIGNCKAPMPIVTNAPLALVNIKVNDALVGCKRPWGPPFCWDEKQTMGTPNP